jgi:hypothetical protein
MGDGGWIALLMLGGTALICIVAFARKPSVTVPIYSTNGGKETADRRLQLEECLNEKLRLKGDIVDYMAQIATLRFEVAYWRARSKGLK